MAGFSMPGDLLAHQPGSTIDIYRDSDVVRTPLLLEREMSVSQVLGQ